MKLVCPHQFIKKNSETFLCTHYCEDVAFEIETMTTAEFEQPDVKFVCCGTVQKMTQKEYVDFSKKYAHEYFTGGKFLKEKIQFPPFDHNLIVSQFAFRIMNILKDCDHHYVVLTHYDAVENLNFLHMSHLAAPSNHAPKSQYRILLFHPCRNTFVNIRFTEKKDDLSIRKEFLNGESDIIHLAAVNRGYLQKEDVNFVNVVAAPNFLKTKQSDICKDCNLLDSQILSSDQNTQRFFDNLLQHKINRISESSKKHYMNMLSQMMCFMATRDGLYAVPTLKADVNEKITTMILSSQQLRCVHNDSKKKIILGPLGSGKTVIALTHLQLYYERCVTKSVIYYVLWSDKTLLLNDVKRYAKKFKQNENGRIKITNAVEIAKEFHLSKLPTVSQLVALLLKKHRDVPFSFIGDEIDGEMFDIKESLSLKQMFETEHGLQMSFVVLFPQSLEKHRTYVSPNGEKEHGKYKFEETGMKVFYLSKAMRTSKKNFKFLLEFEKAISGLETIIKHPVRGSSSEDAILDSNKFVAKFGTEAAIGLNKANSTKEQPVHITEGNKNFEYPTDIDILAATSDDTNISDDYKTMTKLKCNSANLIGHNIQGERPIVVHLNHNQETYEHATVTLAIALKKICINRSGVKRLFFYHTENQMNTLKKIMTLLEIEYIAYGEQTNWECLENGNTIVKNLPKSGFYNLLTEINGCRGAEFSESVCFIDINDTKMRHVTLEGMSRTTDRLIIVSTQNVNNAEETNSPIGHIIKNLIPNYLNEMYVECVIDTDEESPYTERNVSEVKSMLYVNTMSLLYERFLKIARKINYEEKYSGQTDSRQAILKR